MKRFSVLVWAFVGIPVLIYLVPAGSPHVVADSKFVGLMGIPDSALEEDISFPQEKQYEEKVPQKDQRPLDEKVGAGRDSSGIYVSTGSISNVRTSPDFDAPVKIRVRAGTRLQVKGKQGEWLKLELQDGSIGWIHQTIAKPEN
jgi:hypothetical protein